MMDEELATIRSEWEMNQRKASIAASSALAGRDDGGMLEEVALERQALARRIPQLLDDLERWRAVGRAVVRLEYNLPSDLEGNPFCPFCRWSEEGDLASHEATCPLVLIKRLLDAKE